MSEQRRYHVARVRAHLTYFAAPVAQDAMCETLWKTYGIHPADTVYALAQLDARRAITTTCVSGVYFHQLNEGESGRDERP